MKHTSKPVSCRIGNFVIICGAVTYKSNPKPRQARLNIERVCPETRKGTKAWKT